jgi:ribosomal protein S6--L-glutamate ligase
MNIAILSRNPALYSTQSLVKAARQRHHFVRVIDYVNCDLIVETNKVTVQYYGQEVKNIDAIVPRIGSSVTAYGSSVIRQFESQKIFSTLSSNSLYNARNKMTSLQMLASAGLGVPKTMMSNNYLAFSKLIEQIGSPTIIKLLKGTHGLGVLLAEKKNQAESLYETFFKMKQKAVLQEFIKESGGADIRIFIVDQEIVGVMERKARPGDFRSNLHRGGTSKVVPISHEEAEVAKKAVRVLGLSIAGVDMLRSKRGPLILEVNASPGLEGIETTTGVDIAGKIINFIERSVSLDG